LALTAMKVITYHMIPKLLAPSVDEIKVEKKKASKVNAVVVKKKKVKYLVFLFCF